MGEAWILVDSDIVASNWLRLFGHQLDILVIGDGPWMYDMIKFQNHPPSR